MCLEDLKLGRGRKPERPVIAAVTTDGLLVGDARRVALVVSWIAATYFDTAGPTAVVDVIQLFFGPGHTGTPHISTNGPGGPLILRVEDVGQLITGPVSVAISNTSGLAQVTLTPIVTDVNAAPMER